MSPQDFSPQGLRLIEIDKADLEVAGEVPYSEELVQWNISNRPVFEFESTAIRQDIEEIVGKLREK